MAVNSCFVVESNRLLWGNWLVSLLGEGGKLQKMIGTFVCMLMSSPQSLSCLWPYSLTGLVMSFRFSAHPVLIPSSIGRDGNNTPLIRLIYRDGSFLCPKCERAI